MTQFLNAALCYASRGWQVFPCRPRDKKPATATGFKAGTSDEDQIKTWWGERPDRNIGMATGAVSGVVVLEFDPKNGGDETLERLIVQHGQGWLDTLTHKSGGGGRHLFYQCPKWSFPSRVNIRPGMDTRGDGGYIILPPSIHPSGAPYEVLKDCEPATLPDWLAAMLQPTSAPVPVVAPTAGVKRPVGRATLEFLAGWQPGQPWNTPLYKAARDHFQQGYSQDEFLERATRITGHLDAQDLKTIASAFSKPPKHAPRQAEQTSETEEKGQKLNPTEAATRFIAESGYAGVLRTWHRDFYLWDGRRYRAINKDDLRAELLKWLKPRQLEGVTGRFIEDTILNLLDVTNVMSWCAPPCWIDGPSPGEVVTVDNGLVPLAPLLAGQTPVTPIPHTPSFFSLTCLPYEHDATAACPTWLRILEEIQPDPEVRALLQEWFGYNLVYDTTLEKFMLFCGEGANGKSVICLVLRELLGRDAVSAVNLEAFDSKRTFLLAATKGKLANIVEDLNAVERAQEGMLKDFVSGGSMEVEEKHKPPFTLIPTARITFSTNTLPRFTDRSSGLWRRMLYVPFNVQITDEAKQDKRLKSPAFWRAELPGIFNWAVAGLRRLRERGYFAEPRAMREAKADYKKDMNPAQEFLEGGYEHTGDAAHVIGLQDLYDRYEAWTARSKQTTLGPRNFNKEVERIYKGITKDFKWLDDASRRCWIGLREIIDSEVSEESQATNVRKLAGVKKLKGL